MKIRTTYISSRHDRWFDVPEVVIILYLDLDVIKKKRKEKKRKKVKIILTPVTERGKTYHVLAVACGFDIPYGWDTVGNNRFSIPGGLGKGYTLREIACMIEEVMDLLELPQRCLPSSERSARHC